MLQTCSVFFLFLHLTQASNNVTVSPVSDSRVVFNSTAVLTGTATTRGCTYNPTVLAFPRSYNYFCAWNSNDANKIIASISKPPCFYMNMSVHSGTVEIYYGVTYLTDKCQPGNCPYIKHWKPPQIYGSWNTQPSTEVLGQLDLADTLPDPKNTYYM